MNEREETIRRAIVFEFVLDVFALGVIALVALYVTPWALVGLVFFGSYVNKIKNAEASRCQP